MAEPERRSYLDIMSEAEARKFLRALGLITPPRIVQKVVSALKRGKTPREVAKEGFAVEGAAEGTVERVAEGTIRKIQRLWQQGLLRPFSQSPDPDPELKWIKDTLRERRRTSPTQEIDVWELAATIAAKLDLVRQVCEEKCTRGKMERGDGPTRYRWRHSA